MPDADERLARLSPRQRAVLEKRLAARRSSRSPDPIEALPLTDGLYPLSFAQQRLWFVDQLESGSPFFNIAAAIHLAGPLVIAVLRRALAAVVLRHEALRTVFVPPGEPGAQPGQRILAFPPGFELTGADLGTLPAALREREAQSWLARETAIPFDLAGGPLLRARWLRLGAQEHIVVCTVHHIAADWWSLGVLMREATVLYSAFLTGVPAPLSAPPIQYRDFTRWQRQALQGAKLAATLDDLRRRLVGAPRYLPLPTDGPRAAVQSFHGAEEACELPAELVAALRAYGQTHDCTLFMVLVAVYAVFLHAWTGETDLVFSAPTAGRDHEETENLIGMFVNTLLLRVEVAGPLSFDEVLARVRGVITEAYEGRFLPIDRIIEELAPQRSLRYAPMLQASVNLVERDPLAGVSLPGLAVRRHAFDPGVAQFEINWVVAEVGGGYLSALQYRRDLFSSATMRSRVAELRALLERVATRSPFKLGEISRRFEEAERERLERAAPGPGKVSLGGLKGRRSQAVAGIGSGGPEAVRGEILSEVKR